MLYNIGVYLRVSLEDKNKKESESIVNQKHIINSFINSNYQFKNSNIYYYTDDGFSGSNFQRPAIKNLVEDIKKGKINCVIVKDLSRFGRNYIEVSDYLYKIFPFLNIRFISINDNYNSQNNKDNILDLDVAFKNILHNYYLTDLSKKVKTSKSVIAKQGNYIASYTPFGYKKNKETRRLEIDEEQAKIVKMIFNLILEGNKYTQVCKILNSKNIPTKSYFKIKNGERKNYSKCKNENKIWKPQDISKIISDEVYIGNTLHFKRKRIKCGYTKTIKSNENEIIKVENTHQAIISKDLFYSVAPKKRNSKQFIVKNIFAYKLKCGCCGYSLRSREVYKQGILCRKYFCITKNEKENINCYKEAVFEDDLKELVFQSLKNQILILLDILPDRGNTTNLQENILIYEKQIEKYNSDKLFEYEKYIEGDISKDEYLIIKANLEKNISILLNKIKEIKENLFKVNEKDKEVDTLKKYLNNNELTKEMVDKFIKCIYIYDDKTIKIEWKFKNDLINFKF